MRREVTILQLLAALAALVGSVATLIAALVSFVGGATWPAAAFAAGGLVLALWASAQVVRDPA